MKYLTLLGLLLPLGLSAQFSIGYGLGYFPSGMSSLYVEQDFFLNSSYAEATNGPVTQSRKFLPFHHGISVGWSSGSKNKHKVDFMCNWNNLHNVSKLERTDASTQKKTSATKKSRINTFLIGGRFNLESESVESWSLMGVICQHTILNFSNGKSWEKSSKTEADFGVDVGVHLKLSPSAFLYLHYQRCLLMFTRYNPSYLGAQLNFNLGKRK